MYDPMTVAHEIKSPFKTRSSCIPGGYRKTLITIWHVDPEKDGTDDSCGWFKRARHGNKQVLARIEDEFLFNFKNNYWFDANGYRHFSTSGVVLNMYRTALWEVFKNTKRVDTFFRRYLPEILFFAENPVDSIGNGVTRRYGNQIDEEYMRGFARTVYGDILRKTQPWHRHPRWHLHHWKIQVHWPIWMRNKQKQLAPCDENLRATV